MKPSLAGLFLGSVLIVGCRGGAPAETEPEPVVTVESAVARVQSLRELLAVDGSYALAPGDFVQVAPVAGGRLLSVFVSQGDLVRKGQLIAKIDTSVLDSQASSAGATASVARAQALQSEAGLRAARADYESSLKTARLKLQEAIAEKNSAVALAQVELNKVRAGARPQEIGQAEQAVRQAQITRDKASADAERDRRLLREGFVSKQQAESSAATFDVAESALVQARQQLDMVRIGAREEERKAAELNLKSAMELGTKRVELARAALEQAQTGRLSLQVKQREVDSAKLSVNEKTSDLSTASRVVETGEIRAPFNGIVVRGLLGPGDSADTTTPVLELARQGAQIEFMGETSPANVGRLSPGMTVLAGTEAGVLRAIGVADKQSGKVPLRVIFKHRPPNVASGSFARVNIVLRTLAAAIVVPEQAVVSREDSKVIFVIESGVAKMREVEIGPAEGGMIAILRGVKSGQKVVLVGQHELSDGAKIEEAKVEEAKVGQGK